MSLSNYPPGHPTGISHGEESEVYYCEGCNYLLTTAELVVSNDPRHLVEFLGTDKVVMLCPHCKLSGKLERACCEHSGCGEPATHIDTDQAVNAHVAYCSQHNM